MSIARGILRMFGWSVSSRITVPDKCVIVIAPHTSSMDFIWGKLALIALKQKTSFLIKKEFFFFPLGPIIKAMGAIPVDRGKYGSPMATQMKNVFLKSEKFKVVITVEGTRKKTRHWKKGFWVIAREASVPVVYGIVDYKKKEMILVDFLELSDDFENDIALLKSKYSGVTAKNPECFTNE